MIPQIILVKFFLHSPNIRSIIFSSVNYGLVRIAYSVPAEPYGSSVPVLTNGLALITAALVSLTEPPAAPPWKRASLRFVSKAHEANQRDWHHADKHKAPGRHTEFITVQHEPERSPAAKPVFAQQKLLSMVWPAMHQNNRKRTKIKKRSATRRPLNTPALHVGMREGFFYVQWLPKNFKHFIYTHILER